MGISKLSFPRSQREEFSMSADAFDMAVIIPANNEEKYVENCIRALLAQDRNAGRLQIIVAANACTDKTVEIVNGLVPKARARDWELLCQDSSDPGKLCALNRADKLVRAPKRAYLDADVVCDPDLFGKIRAALDRQEPTYATGALKVAPAKSWITQRYADIWVRLPFMRGGAVGAGLFAVNHAGRARWGEFPPIISDDTYARLQFSPDERIEVASNYYWPMVEGLANLITVRRRQDVGVLEVYSKYPSIRKNENKKRNNIISISNLAVRFPISFSIYMFIFIAAHLKSGESGWNRGR